MTRNKIMSDDSSDDEFLEYLLDDNGDDDDYYDDDVSLFALVKAYILELSSKNCVQFSNILLFITRGYSALGLIIIPLSQKTSLSAK